MSRRILFATAGVLMVFVTAGADDPIMGIWQGTFTAKDWANEQVTAYVIGVGNDQYRILFLTGPEDAPKLRSELAGLERRDVLVGIGELDLGQESGGVYVVSLEATDGKLRGRMTGTRDNQRVEIPFEMKKICRQSPTLGEKPPPDAVVLFDGSTYDAWNLHPGLVSDGALKIVTKNTFISKQEFGDCKIHIEFCTPYMPKEPTGAQSRGNSGVYVQGRYEVQVLDSFGEPPADNYCGGIYRVATPKTNACLPPGEWQTYDIIFRAPRFDDAGNKTKSAEITVQHNGVLIHDKIELPRTTPGGASDTEAKTGPLLLQNHGDAVQYRNIWVQPLR